MLNTRILLLISALHPSLKGPSFKLSQFYIPNDVFEAMIYSANLYQFQYGLLGGIVRFNPVYCCMPLSSYDNILNNLTSPIPE
jgi:hypothetical protein